jgi:hypothetical protein
VADSKPKSSEIKAADVPVPARVFATVLACPRCGGLHAQTLFLRLERPSQGYTHWASCPANGEPLLASPDNAEAKPV